MNKLFSFLLAAGCAALASVAVAQDIKGDAQAGAKKNAMCIGCHGIVGYKTNFPEVYQAPKISGQNAPYIAAALTAYKNGERKHPSMRGIAQSLSEQDIADLAAYYSTHGGSGAKKIADKVAKAPDQKTAALLTKGACQSCHGNNFSQPIDPRYPKISGQHADYLFVALKSYKTEGQATWGRSNGVMGGVTQAFSNAELKALSQYLSSLDGEVQTIAQSPLR